MLKQQYNIESNYTPFLFIGPNTGKMYAMPGWLDVPLNTTIDQLVHVKPQWLKIAELNKPKVVGHYQSSKGDLIYSVYLAGKEYSCDCPGYRFRNKKCKHILQELSK